MPKLNRVSSKKAIKKLKRAGFEERYQQGSHIYFKKGERRTTVPFHGSKDLAIGTLQNILKQAGLSVEEFNNL